MAPDLLNDLNADTDLSFLEILDCDKILSLEIVNAYARLISYEGGVVVAAITPEYLDTSAQTDIDLETVYYKQVFVPILKG